MKSQATTVAQYASEVPAERQAAFGTVLGVIRNNLPDGYEETINWGMPCWQVPLAVKSDTYNKQPLMFVALASQKNYLSLYLVPAYEGSPGRQKLEASGKKLKAGKGCYNFLTAEELPLKEIGEIIHDCPISELIKIYDTAQDRRAARKEAAK